MSCVQEENIVFLTISSFVGVGVGAKHWYGKLEHLQGGDTFEVTYPLSREDARAFNRDWRTKHPMNLGYQEGEQSERFPSRKGVIAAARKQFKKEFPKATVLVLGRTGVVEPQKILVGPREFKTKINILAREYDKLDWDRSPEDKLAIRKLEKKWQKLWPRKYT